jgi:hypothetical protein
MRISMPGAFSRPALRAWLLLAAGAISSAAGAAGPRDQGLLGAWLLEDGRVLTLAPGTEGTWRYRLVDSGRSGRLHRVDDRWQEEPGFDDRTPARTTFVPTSAAGGRWREGNVEQEVTKVPLLEREVSFQGAGGIALAGRLVIPVSPHASPVVVLVHGSERTGAVGQWHEPYLLAAHGIGAFVYDKRGTGRSGGAFTMDFATLAADAAAAYDAAARQPGVDASRIGFEGHSQGGWVAPLAASLRPASDAVLVAYGSASSPLDEDRFQCLLDVPVADRAAANALVDASHVLLKSRLEQGWPAYREQVAASRRAPWFDRLGNCIARQFHRYPAWVVRKFAASRLPPGLVWDHDAGRVLEQLDQPMLWLLAAEDREAPSADTAARVEALARGGKPFRHCMFPAANHGMVLLDRKQGGVVTGYAPGYFAAVVRFWQARFGLPASANLPTPCG